MNMLEATELVTPYVTYDGPYSVVSTAAAEQLLSPYQLERLRADAVLQVQPLGFDGYYTWNVASALLFPLVDPSPAEPPPPARPQLRLQIFAHHVQYLALDTTRNFGLHPCEGVDVQVEISGVQLGTPSIHDQVRLNGKACGNRAGGIAEFTRLVCEANPEILFDQPTDGL